MSISVNSLYNELLSNIQSRLRMPYDMSGFNLNTGKSAAKNVNAVNTIDVYENEKAPETEEDFQSILINYLEGGNTSDEGISQEIQDSILDACAKYNVDVNLVKAVIQQESSYNQYALSSAGAMGLMQLMPKTAEGLGVTDAYDISQNIDAGTNYLKQMLSMFNNDTELALAAYNAGPNAVQKYNGVPPYKETQNYIPSVLGYKEQYLLQQYASNQSL